ncbi:MAG: hypothetical protein IIC79_01375 [Chloroflexi bacterium]|nr:hypothetical protein [Chloroflexota bacterium]
MSWLEGLAAKQGAAEDELLTKPEERTEDAPDWLPESNQTNKEQSPALAMPDDGDVEEKLSWLDSGGEEESRADSPAQDEQPDQIENMEEKLSWLDDLGDSDVDIESPAQDKIGDSTEWMQSLIEEEVGSTDTVESPDDAPEWLQSISAENLETADQSTAPSSEKDVPEWLPELSVDPSDESAPEDAPPAQEEEKEPAWPDGFSNLPDDQSEDPLAFLKENDPFVIEETTVPDNELVQDDKVESLQPEDDPPESPIPDPPKPRKIPTKKKKSLSDEDYRLKLTTARDSVNAGNLEEAMAGFGELIKRRKYLDDIIADLQAALIKHPIDVSTWQTLGDAYMRADRLQDALDSYSKAEDLLR